MCFYFFVFDAIWIAWVIIVIFIVEVPDEDSHPERSVEVYQHPESKYLYNDILTEDSHPEQK